MKTFIEKRKDERLPHNLPFLFTVLSSEGPRYSRVKAEGEIVDASRSGVGIKTAVPLEPGHVLTWDDKHQKGMLHIALVKWAREQDDHFRAGLVFI